MEVIPYNWKTTGQLFSSSKNNFTGRARGQFQKKVVCILGPCVYKVRLRREDGTREEREVCERDGRKDRERGQESAMGRGRWSIRCPPPKILERGLSGALVFMLSRPVLY